MGRLYTETPRQSVTDFEVCPASIVWEEIIAYLPSESKGGVALL